MSRKTREGLDCRKCGACCVALGEQDAWCDVDDTDLERLSPEFRRKNVRSLFLQDAIRAKWTRQRSGALKGLDLNTCVALRGSVLHRVSCSIYERRPRVCRGSFQPGDRGCLEVRRAVFSIIED